MFWAGCGSRSRVAAESNEFAWLCSKRVKGKTPPVFPAKDRLAKRRSGQRNESSRQ